MLLSRRFYLATFGCRTNQADSAAIRQDFLDQDYREVRELRQADVIVINSCTVTHRSDQQVRQLTRRLRRENERARILVTGCYAQRDPEALARIKGVTAVVGNTWKNRLVEITTQSNGQIPVSTIYRQEFERSRLLEAANSHQVGGRTRPFVKIQDGCDAKCAYCIIPQVRGGARSVPPKQVLEQVRELVARGFQEVVLTGIHIGSYGMHWSPRFPLDRLLQEIVSTPGLGQVRISSIEPMQLSRRIVRLAADNSKIAPHFHICLQSGSDSILRGMLRPYDTARFASIVEEIRSRMPNAGIGTDLIVGFPGETEQRHQETLEFVDRMPFTYLHVFPYSDRPDTVASEMEGKVTAEVMSRRASQLRALSDAKNEAFCRSFVGREVSLLTLTRTKGNFREGMTGNYLKALVHPGIAGNRLVTGVVQAIDGEYLVVET